MIGRLRCALPCKLLVKKDLAYQQIGITFLEHILLRINFMKSWVFSVGDLSAVVASMETARYAGNCLV